MVPDTAVRVPVPRVRPEVSAVPDPADRVPADSAVRVPVVHPAVPAVVRVVRAVVQVVPVAVRDPAVVVAPRAVEDVAVVAVRTTSSRVSSPTAKATRRFPKAS